MGKYEGKKAVIIGGTHGMGRAVVDELLAGGAQVLLTGRNKENIETAEKELAGTATVVRSDVTDIGSTDALVEAVRRDLGEVDFLHVNVGYAHVEPFDQVSESAYDRMFNTNTKGVFFTVQKLAPLLRDGGAVVFTTAVTNATGTPTMSVYSGTKAAVLAFARVFAAELLPRGIRVNTVAPGFIHTKTMGFTDASDAEREAITAMGDQITPMRRHGTAEEIAKASLFLGFDATFTTGVELPVDGGLGPGIQYPG